MSSIYDFSAKTIDGDEKPLSDFTGQALLVVNVASKCGFTPQYKGLEQVYEDYASKGFAVLGFPCDQFGHQEPGDEAQIQDFCSLTYGVTFPMFSKVEVNGDGAHPLYKWLRSQKSGLLGNRIKWNFTKFLVDREGRVMKRYGSTTKPQRISSDIEKLIGS